MKRRTGEWEASTGAVENARREMPLFAKEYFSAGRKASRKGVSAGDLHQFRLLTKHFRYTLELFRPLYGPLIEERLKQLKKVQTVLGELNDYAATRELLMGSPLAAHADVQKLFRFLKKCFDEKRKEFRSVWIDEFDRLGEEGRWVSYLTRYAGVRKRAVARSIIEKPATVGG